PVSDTINETHLIAFCYRDSQMIYAPPGTVRHRWQDGSRDSCFVVQDTGTYILQSIQQCVLRNDTFRVIFPDTLFSNTDTNICNGQTVTLTPPQGRDSYVWDDLSSAPVRTVAATGIYYVYSSLDCQPYIDSFTVRPTDIHSGL